MTAEWHYARGETKHGPVTEARLRELAATGDLLPTDRVWQKGTAGWVKAGTVPGLFPDDGPPPLDTPAAAPARDWLHALWRRVWADKLAFVAACFAVCFALFLVVPSLFGTKTTHSESPWGSTQTTGPSDGARFTGTVFGLASLTLFVAVAVMGFLRFMRFAVRDNLYGRWEPLEGDHPWIEFIRGGTLSRGDGFTASFRFNPDDTLDVWRAGTDQEQWKVVSIGAHELVVRDRHGALRRYRKGKTFEQKQANPLRKLFHTTRTAHLPGSWLPADGSGEWVQFTDDGAVVYSDGRAGRYTVTGEEPNEVVRVKLADGSASEYRVLSLSKTQLVIVEGTQARTYTRNAPAKAASSGSGAAHGPSDPPQAEEATGGGVGAVVSGVWNWLSGKEPCPGCKSRSTAETGRTLRDERQEVRTDWKRADGRVGYRPQATFNVQVWEVRYKCAACGKEWFQDEEKAEMA